MARAWQDLWKKHRSEFLEILDLELGCLAASLLEPGLVAQAASMSHEDQQHLGLVASPRALLGQGGLEDEVRVVFAELGQALLQVLVLESQAALHLVELLEQGRSLGKAFGLDSTRLGQVAVGLEAEAGLDT